VKILKKSVMSSVMITLGLSDDDLSDGGFSDGMVIKSEQVDGILPRGLYRRAQPRMEGGGRLHRMLERRCQGRLQPLSIPIPAQPMATYVKTCASSRC